MAAEEVPPEVSPDGFVLHEIEKNPSCFLFCLQCSFNQASHFTPSMFFFFVFFLLEINTLICSRRCAPQGSVLSAAVAAASVRVLALLLLVIYLFNWVLEGLCDLGASSGFSMKNSKSMRLSKGDVSSSTKKSNLLTVHIRLAFFFLGTLSLKVWRTKGEREGERRRGGSSQALSSPRQSLSASFRLEIQSMELILCCCRRCRHPRRLPIVSPSSRRSHWAARESQSLRSRRLDSRSSGRHKQV